MGKIKFNRNFSKNRSDKYQHVLVESSCSPEILTEFSELRGIAGFLNMTEYNEEYLNLRDKLHQELWRLMKEVLTNRQYEIIVLTAQGYTQVQIANKLGVNQSSITKSINGNCDYKKGRRIYGGARKKLRAAVKKDERVQEILSEMAELVEEMSL